MDQVLNVRHTFEPAPSASATPSPAWYTHGYNQPVFYHLAATVASWLPRAVCFRIARRLAAVLCHKMPREYAAVQQNIAHLLPEVSADERVRRTQLLFQNFACFFTDLLSLNRRSAVVQQRYVYAVHGLQHLETLLATSTGFVAATAHLGNWELAGRLLSSYGRPVHVLMAPEQNAAVQRLLRTAGTATNLQFVSNSEAGAMMRLLMALRRGDIVAVQMDRATGHRSDLVVPFFGAPARFPTGPFKLAQAAQVPVLPCFCLMRPDERYEIFVEAPVVVPRGHEEAALRQTLHVLERYVARAPEQWCNFYDVWNV